MNASVSSGNVELEPALGPRIALVLVATPAVAALVKWVAGPGPVFQNVTWPAVAAALAAFVLGIPLLGWSMERGFTRLHHVMLLGVVAGISACVLILLSGIVGQYIHSNDWSYVGFVLSNGAPIPGYGQLSWPRAFETAAYVIGIGAGSGAVCWVVPFVAASLRRQ